MVEARRPWQDGPQVIADDAGDDARMMRLDWWLAFALAMLSMKQIKALEYLGPGELIFLIIAVMGVVMRPKLPQLRARFISFQLSMGMIVALGFSFTISTGLKVVATGSSGQAAMVDGLSVWASIGITYVIVRAVGGERALRVLAWSCVIAAIANALVLFVTDVTGIKTIGPMEFYFYTRFQGLSSDPNQLSRICTVAPFLVAVEYLRYAHGGKARFFLILGLLCAVALGIDSESQTCWVAWVGGGCMSIVVFVMQRAENGRLGPIGLLALVTMLLWGAAMIVFLIVNRHVGLVGELFTYLSDEGGSQREEIAAATFNTVKSAALFGFGFGQHVPWETRAHGTILMESHNVILDCVVRGGVAGLGLFIIAAVLALTGAVRMRGAAIAGLVVASLLFGLGVTPIRQPIFWLVIVIAASGGWRRLAPASRREEGPQLSGTGLLSAVR